MKNTPENIITHLEESIINFHPPTPEKIVKRERYFGEVKETENGMTIIEMEHIAVGNLVHFENGNIGITSSLYRDENKKSKACILLFEKTGIRVGETVYSDNEPLSVIGGWDTAGRILDGIGHPLDGGRTLEKGEKNPIEKDAPPYYTRQNVDTPLYTGYTVVDGLIPIGLGQRELIIGDRHTGKTTFAIDTINNQKNNEMLCIYVAVGKKRQDTIRIIEALKTSGALKYTVVIMAPADTTPAMQLYAPFCGCAIGESIRDNGGNALIVYDDLTAHAWAYRQASLMQKRNVGREAYPGDIFSLHARLLERSARLADTLQVVQKDTQTPMSNIFTGYLNKNLASRFIKSMPNPNEFEIKVTKKGGTLTALPIIQTEQGDFSGYVTTNAVSITDGQINLDTSQFRSNDRPAVHVGLSVSRVGGEAQPPSIKNLSGGLRTNLANLKDLAAASILGKSNLEINTQIKLNHGEHIQKILIQEEGIPRSVAEHVVLLYNATDDVINFDTIPLNDTCLFINQYLKYLNFSHIELMTELNRGSILNANQKQEIDLALQNFKEKCGYKK
jgi:F-type H+/Na+-transporting ATPase subunit alpha